MSCSKDIRLVRKWIWEEKSKTAPGKKGMFETRKQKKGKGCLGFAVGEVSGDRQGETSRVSFLI